MESVANTGCAAPWWHLEQEVCSLVYPGFISLCSLVIPHLLCWKNLKKQMHKCNFPTQTFYSRVLGASCIFLHDCGVRDGCFLLLPGCVLGFREGENGFREGENEQL